MNPTHIQNPQRLQLAQAMNQQSPMGQAPEMLMRYLMANKAKPTAFDPAAVPSATATPYNPSPMPGNFGGDIAYNAMYNPMKFGGGY